MQPTRPNALALSKLGGVELNGFAFDLVHHFRLRNKVGSRRPILIEIKVGCPTRRFLADFINADDYGTNTNLVHPRRRKVNSRRTALWRAAAGR